MSPFVKRLSAGMPWPVNERAQVETDKELAPRRGAAFTCDRGHTMALSFAADVELPGAWTCRHCGETARRDGAPEDAEPDLPGYSHIGVPKGQNPGTSPMEQLMKRRTPAELDAILAERIGRSKRFGGGAVTLTTRQPMRSCGRPFGTEDEALSSKRGQSGNYLAGRCRTGCPDGTWHLRRKPVSAGVTRKPTADTGPARLARSMVLSRDGYACVACGRNILTLGDWWSIQHRVARGQGGTNDLSNLITLCGSATSPGCHLKCEQRDREMQAKGYWLESWQDPRAEAVMYFSPDGSGVSMYLDDEGNISPDAPAGAA